jgi:hypothetical protein
MRGLKRESHQSMVASTRPFGDGSGWLNTQAPALLLGWNASTFPPAHNHLAESPDPRSLGPEAWSLVKEVLTLAMRPSATRSRMETACGMLPVNPGRGPDYPVWPTNLGKGVGLCPNLLWEEP